VREREHQTLIRTRAADLVVVELESPGVFQVPEVVLSNYLAGLVIPAGLPMKTSTEQAAEGLAQQEATIPAAQAARVFNVALRVRLFGMPQVAVVVFTQQPVSLLGHQARGVAALVATGEKVLPLRQRGRQIPDQVVVVVAAILAMRGSLVALAVRAL
jgi:hypothetical protein